MKENSEIQEDLGNGGKFKNWLQDNIRIILSILIVVTIAAGIYSYSKRTVVPVGEMGTDAEVNLAKVDIEKEIETENNAVVVVGEDNQDNKIENAEDNSNEELSVGQVDGEVTKESDVAAEEEANKVAAEEAAKKVAEEEANNIAAEEAAKKVAEEEANKVAAEEAAKKAAEEEANKIAAEEVSKEVVEETQDNVEVSSTETDTSFVEVAKSGDSLTTLSRQAIKQYLENNQTEGLSAEHKIYMEDYLRRNVGHSTALNIGDEVTFSKDLISNAINAASNLNEGQLKNLQKYSSMVNGL